MATFSLSQQAKQIQNTHVVPIHLNNKNKIDTTSTKMLPAAKAEGDTTGGCVVNCAQTGTPSAATMAPASGGIPKGSWIVSPPRCPAWDAGADQAPGGPGWTPGSVRTCVEAPYLIRDTGRRAQALGPSDTPAPKEGAAGPEGEGKKPLNPFAEEFLPFNVILSHYDEVDKSVDDSGYFDDHNTSKNEIRVDDIHTDEALWSQFRASDDLAEPFAPCPCHQKPRGSCPSFKQYHVDRISRGLRQTGITPNMDGLREPLKFPSFPIETWKWAMSGYFDAHEILQAMQYGWDVSFTEHPKPKDAKWNLQGASLFENDVQIYVDQELQFGALVGPFEDSELPFKTYCSPLNTVIKKNSEVRRTVVDCTQLDLGINSFIDAHVHRGKVWKLSLPTSQTIISLIQRARRAYPGQRILIWKLDFARWYRWFLLDPVAATFFAIRWRGKVYLDTVLSFGNRAAALAAQRVIWAVVYIFRTRVPPFPGSFNTGVSCTCEFHCECGENLAAGYIDDLIGISCESLATSQFESAISLASTLGLRLSKTPGHISPPSATCECLGILYDTDENTMRLPQDKVDDIVAILLVWVTKPRATEHELAVLCGKLLYCANVIFAGRLFLNRCLATKRFASKHAQPITLTEDFREDIKWWQTAVLLRNGVSFLVPESSIHVSLDASSNGWHKGQRGLGGYNHSTNQYFSCGTPPDLSHLAIADLELLAHVVAIHLWGSHWRKFQVTIHTDNQACWWLLTKGRTREDIRLRMSRWMATQQIKQRFRISSAWIPTTENNLADALSRVGDPSQQRKFDEHCTQLGGTPSRCHVRPEFFGFDS